MKKFARMLRRNGLLSFAIVGAIIGGVLQVLHQPTAAHWVLGSFAGIGGLTIFVQAIQHVRSGGYGLDILAVAAVIAGIWQHQWWTALVVVIIWCLNRVILAGASRRVARQLNVLASLKPRAAEVIRSRKTVSARASELHAGDKIVVASGTVVPADAVIIEGESAFSELVLTGEQEPLTRGVGDSILAGSINQGDSVTAKVSASLVDSQYSQLARIVRAAHATSAPFSRLSARYSLPFTIMAFAVGVAMWVISGESVRFLDVLVVATPFPLMASAPLALTGGILRASRYGIILKSASALQQLAEIETMVFEKTGLLSSQGFAVAGVQTFGSFGKAEVVSLAASLEQASLHPVALAITRYAEAESVKLVKTKHVRSLNGGLGTHYKGQDLVIGNLRTLESEGVQLPKNFKPNSITQTASYLAIGGQLAGIITFDSAADTQITSALQRLRKLGIKQFIMVTGDSQTASEALGAELGINAVHADLDAGGKLHAIERIMKRPVAFVGDGVHDTAALTASDVGIAVGARAATHAADAASVVVLSANLNRVASAVAIAAQTFKLAFSSIVIGMILTLGLIVLFATGSIAPIYGAVAQLAVTIVTAASAIRTARV